MEVVHVFNFKVIYLQKYKLTNHDMILKKKEWKSKEQARKEAEELALSKLGGSAADRAAQFLEEEQSD